MIPEERLTAYALNDPSVDGAERAEIELHLEADENARRVMDETRHLAGLLAEGLAKEVAPADVVPLTLAASARGAWPASRPWPPRCCSRPGLSAIATDAVESRDGRSECCSRGRSDP